MSSELWRAFVAVAEDTPGRCVVVAVETGAGLTAWELAERALRLREEAGLAGARGGCVAFALPTSPDWIVTFLAAQAAGVATLALEAASGDWHREAAILGATHVLEGGRLAPLDSRRRDIAWGRYVLGKVTSGSTGAPAVIPCRAGHLLADGRNIVRTMKIRPRDRNLAILPLGHSYGLGNLVMPLLLQGTAVVTAESYVPRQILEWLSAYRVTVFPAVPVILQILTGIEDRDLPRGLRLVISAGAPLPASTARDFLRRFRRRVRNFYGSSETGGICFDASGAASLTGRSVGRPLDGVRVEVTRAGRIRVRGAAVAKPRGIHTLADLGGWNTEGELQIKGRLTPMANIGGRKVDPREVETALLAIRGVRAAWVSVKRNDDRDRLVAAVESNCPRKEILHALAGSVVRWKRPGRLVVVCALPRTARGKLDAPALRALFA